MHKISIAASSFRHRGCCHSSFLSKLLEFTMKLSTTFLLLPTVASAAFTPARVSFDDLMQGREEATDVIASALASVGMVSVTNIPGFTKAQALASIPKCIQQATTTFLEDYNDGTQRESLGSRWSGMQNQKSVEHGTTHDDCMEFEKETAVLTSTASKLAKVFANTIESSFDIENAPILQDYNEKSKDFTLSDIVDEGEHIEHFHSYTRSENSDEAADTIEWHVDQGLFLIFTPGQLQNQLTDGFFIRLPDGSEPMVQFETQDEMVLMLGDGVNQFVNHATHKTLRAVPHALRMSPTADEPRVWYGRMVLPPLSAQHPQEDLSYGDVQSAMDLGRSNSIGCSSQMRVLSGGLVCDEAGTHPCWHRCMNVTEGETADDCTAKDETLVCLTVEAGERVLWDGATHSPIFYPGCASNTSEVYVPCQGNATKDENLECQCNDGFTEDDNGNCVEDSDDTSGAFAGILSMAWISAAGTAILAGLF